MLRNTDTLAFWVVCIVLAALTLPLSAAGWVTSTDDESPKQAATMRTNIRVVIVEGEALITKGDMYAARDKAKNQALRVAIEKAIGVYVDATSVGKDFQMVKEEIYTHSSGYAYVDEVLSESAEDGILRLKARIAVSLDPLVDTLAASGLTRRWRIMVVIPESHIRRRIPDPAAETAVVHELLQSKYRLVDQDLAAKLRYDPDMAAAHRGDPAAIKGLFGRSKADILIIGEAVSQGATNIGQGVSCRARVEVKAIRSGSGEIISSVGAQEGGVDLTEEMAAKTALDRAGQEAAKTLLHDIAMLPSATSLPIELVIHDCPSITVLGKIESQIKGIAGVRSVQRDDFDEGVAYLEVAVDSASMGAFQTALERIKSPRLAVSKASKNSVEARITN